MTTAGAIQQAPTAADILALEETAPGRFRSRLFKDNPLDFVFGGRPVAQALAAAARTTPGARPRACSAVYLGRGRDDVPIDYAVETLRDGRALAVRRVRASQAGAPIFEMLCTLAHGVDAPPALSACANGARFPETTPSLRDFVASQPDAFSERARAIYLHPFPVEIRFADPEAVLLGGFGGGGARGRQRDYWLRLPSASAIEDPIAHRCLIGYLSDYWFASIVGAFADDAGGGGAVILTASHTLAFHGDARADSWLLYRTEAAQAGPGGGFVRGTIHDRKGPLVASATQDVVIRNH